MTEHQNLFEFYRPELNKRELKELSRRNDANGLWNFFTWLTVCMLSGAGVIYCINTPFLVIALLLHGVMLSFSYAASHESAHGTAFKTRWLNEAVFWLTSLVFGEEPIYRRYSHTSHHTYTWFQGLDAQMPYRNPVSLRQYLMETVGILFFWESIHLLWTHSFDHVSDKTKEFVPESEIPNMRRNSAIFLLIYGCMIATVFIFNTSIPLFLYFIPRVLGGWVANLYINTQHMCMQEGLTDHRYTTRSIECGKLSRWLYWNMNFHIEHHIFPMVPFHALPKLNSLIASQLPLPAKGGVLGANLELLRLILRQRSDPLVVAKPEFRN